MDVAVDADGEGDADGGLDVEMASPDKPAARLSLVDHHLWERLEAELDPGEDRPDDVVCEAMATRAEPLGEELTFGIDTELCNYLAVQQPTREAVVVGETIFVRLWHFSLSAPEPAMAHAWLSVGGRVILDENVPIPSEGGLITAEVVVEQDIAAGSPVYFHLHNHGENSWALVEVSAGP